MILFLCLNSYFEPILFFKVRQGIKSKEQQPAHSSSAASTPLPQTEDAGCSLAETPPEGVPEGGGSSTPQEAGFKPFASDPDKQKRYELYLKMKEKGMRSKCRNRI